MLTLHNPDTHNAERPVFLPIAESEQGIHMLEFAL